jgi:hypothetical protein
MSASRLPKTTAGELRRRHRIVVLAICCTSLLVVMMDDLIVNLARPAIRAGLHASVTVLQWAVDAFTLVLAGFLVLASFLVLAGAVVMARAVNEEELSAELLSPVAARLVAR